jgi:hypothetical protein
MQRLQMTSPSIRRQRTYDRQPIAQPNFVVPSSHYQASDYDPRQGSVLHQAYAGLPSQESSRPDQYTGLPYNRSIVSGRLLRPCCEWCEQEN